MQFIVKNHKIIISTHHKRSHVLEILIFIYSQLGLSKKLVVCDSKFGKKSQLTRSIELRSETNQISSVRILFRLKLKLDIIRSKLARELFRFKSQINMYCSN